MYKKFKAYQPDEKLYGDDVIYLRDEAGNDWYEVQAAFSESTLKVTFDDNGLILSQSRDVSALYPLGASVAEFDTDLEDVTGYYVKDGKLVEPPPSKYHGWDEKTAQWVLSDENQKTFLSQKKTALLSALNNKIEDFTSKLFAEYSDVEIATFERQELEARGQLPTMLLDEIYAGRTEDYATIDDLKAKVIDKADIASIIKGKWFVIKNDFVKQIEAAGTIEELDEIEKKINQWQKI